MSFNAEWVVLICLAIFMLYWWLSAPSVKPIEKTQGWLAGNWYTILLLTGFLLIANFKFLSRLGIPAGWLGARLLPASFYLDVLVVLLAAGGLTVAIVARRTLGRNWSGAVAIKSEHELVTAGLYRYSRHPIYTGVLMLAAAAGLSVGTERAGLGFLIILLGVLLKLRDEERLLFDHFPRQYEDYRRRTKRLVPFIW